jgi:hypothetical protein
MIPLCRRHTVLYKTHHDSVRTTYAWPSSQRLPLAWWPWSQSRPVAYGSPTSLKAVCLHTHAVQYIATRSLHRRDVMVSLRANVHPSTQNTAQKAAHAVLHIKRDITKSANCDKYFAPCTWPCSYQVYPSIRSPQQALGSAWRQYNRSPHALCTEMP